MDVILKFVIPALIGGLIGNSLFNRDNKEKRENETT